MKKLMAIVLTAVFAISCIIAPSAAVQMQINTPTMEDPTSQENGWLIGFDVNYMPSAPKMDGVINEGEYYRINFADVKKYFNFIIGTSLADTVSFEDLEKFAKDEMDVYAAWHKGDLYLALSAYAGKADYNCQFTDNEMYLFRGWCLQVAVTDMKSVNEDRAEVGIGYDPNSKEMISFTKWGNRKNVDLVAGEDFGTNWDKDAERVTYEIRLDLSDILGASPKNNDTFRLGFCLCMGDGDITSDNMQKQIEFGHGIAASKVVDNLAITTLVGNNSGVEDEGDDTTVADTTPPEEEQEGFNAADRFDKDGAAAIFDITDGSVTATDVTDENGEKFVRLTVNGKNPIIGSSDLTQGLNMDAAGAYIAIKYRTTSEKSNTFAVNFTNSSCPELNREYDYECDFGLGTDGEWHTMVFEMDFNPDWQQFITNFYLCPFTSAEDPTGETIDIQWIKYYSAAPAFDDESFEDKFGDNIKVETGDDTIGEVTEDEETNAPATNAVTSASTSKTDDNGGSDNTIVIVVAVVAVVVVVAVVAFIIVKRKKN